MKKPPKTTKVPVNSLQSYGIVNQDLSQGIVNRIRMIYERVKRYATSDTLEQWELDFMRDARVESELDLWEKMADAVEIAAEEMRMDSKLVFPIVLGYTCGAIKAVNRAQKPARNIIAVCKRVGLVPTPVGVERQ